MGFGSTMGVWLPLLRRLPLVPSLSLSSSKSAASSWLFQINNNPSKARKKKRKVYREKWREWGGSGEGVGREWGGSGEGVGREGGREKERREMHTSESLPDLWSVSSILNSSSVCR